ncbi:PAS domain-containing protein [Thalassorhabdus alkalitolerans]|uniref:histidine kinase n=1 Tax=Thalassorhabdus alkalitolerans TaxID=2282697 RepID=A0ABW0YNI9_9BACI
MIKREPETLLSNIKKIEDPQFRKALQHTLKELTDLKFALDESTIVAITDHKGKIIYVNDKFCEISKYKREEVLGKDHRIINSGYHSKEFMKGLWQTILSGNVWKGEIKNKAKDHTYYWVNTTIVPFLDENNKPYQFLAIRNEVTKLKKTEEELKQMMKKVIGIQEEERKRFSRELHDGIGQSLYSLLIQMDQLISEGEQERVTALREQVTYIIEEVRNMAWELRPAVLDDLGIVPAVRKYVTNFSNHYGIMVDTEFDVKTRLEIEKETAIYRIIQESLTNIAKYADVSRAYVSIIEKQKEIEIFIIDKGKGFVRNRHHKGVGLFSMEERANAIDAHFSLKTEKNKGTSISLQVPKESP